MLFTLLYLASQSLCGSFRWTTVKHTHDQKSQEGIQEVQIHPYLEKKDASKIISVLGMVAVTLSHKDN